MNSSYSQTIYNLKSSSIVAIIWNSFCMKLKCILSPVIINISLLLVGRKKKKEYFYVQNIKYYKYIVIN